MFTIGWHHQHLPSNPSSRSELLQSSSSLPADVNDDDDCNSRLLLLGFEAAAAAARTVWIHLQYHCWEVVLLKESDHTLVGCGAFLARPCPSNRAVPT
jgi:hypothetical protein